MAKRSGNKAATKPPSSDSASIADANTEKQSDNRAMKSSATAGNVKTGTCASKPNVSYCKTAGHERFEIEAACY